MKHEQNTIKCWKCGESLDISEALYKDVEGRLRGELAAESALRERELVREVGEKVRGEIGIEVATLKEELDQKSLQLRELNQAKSEVERLRREKAELRDEISLEKERELTEQLRIEKAKMRINVEDEFTFKIKELEKKLEDQQKLADEMKRKAEQGSVQLQGEVQEIEIGRLLRELYVVDKITDVKNGQHGADLIHTVRNQAGIDCGAIYYESKRTKKFDPKWLAKLREDNLSLKADILVLVTEAFPEEFDGYAYRDGVWITSLRDVKGLSLVLRHGLLNLQDKLQIQVGRESKADLIYNYVTGPEFRGQFEAIFEGFKSLQDGHAKEKLQVTKVWKEREKQLDRILVNAAGFYGSIKGIAGSAIGEVKLLEVSLQDEESLVLAMPE